MPIPIYTGLAAHFARWGAYWQHRATQHRREADRVSGFPNVAASYDRLAREAADGANRNWVNMHRWTR